MCGRSTSHLLGQRPIICTYALIRGSLGYLNGETLTNEDNRSSLCSQEKFGIAVCFIFEEIKQVIFEDVSMVF